MEVRNAVVGALVGGFAGIVGTLEYVERKAREDQAHTSELKAHTEKLKTLKEESWYAKGEREALDARLRALELARAREEAAR